MSVTDDESRLVTQRLELVLLGRAFLKNWLASEPGLQVEFLDPARFLAGAEDVVHLRLQQLDEAPELAPWLLRAIVVRDERIAVGFIGFHAAPDASGLVEIGYEVLSPFRRCGLGSEAVTAMIAWAGRRGARTVRASVSPDNAASLALLARQGFALVGERLDDEDGLELVFDKATELRPS